MSLANVFLYQFTLFGNTVCIFLQQHRLRRLTPITAHLPFDRTFGPSYPEYLGKEDLAKGHREWAGKFGIVGCFPAQRERLQPLAYLRK